MTATDELRRLLDERGVEWVDTDDGSTLIPAQTATNVAWDVNTWPSGKDMGDCLWVQNRHPLTPEQAIAATLGETPTPPPPTPPKQPPYDELIESLRRDWDIEASWDGLRRFWYVGLTDEGVRKRDEREATLGRWTCRDSGVDHAYWECSECGARLIGYYHVDGMECGSPDYCPNCGRKVME